MDFFSFYFPLIFAVFLIVSSSITLFKKFYRRDRHLNLDKQLGGAIKEGKWNTMFKVEEEEGNCEYQIYYDNWQVGVLHTQSSYLRLVLPELKWGTSLVILPIYRVFGMERPVHAGKCRVLHASLLGPNLLVRVQGDAGFLKCNVLLDISPPGFGSLSMNVTVEIDGIVALDPSRKGEIFKAVLLSSMYQTPAVFDCHSVYNGYEWTKVPAGNHVIFSPLSYSNRLTLDGGKTKRRCKGKKIYLDEDVGIPERVFVTPTVDVYFDRKMVTMGWVKETSDPNDDNVGVWFAEEEVLTRYSYRTVIRIPVDE